MNNLIFTADAEGVTFLNEVQLDEEGWAMLAPYGDFPGRGVLVEEGQVKAVPGIQRVDRAAGEAIQAEFNNLGNRIKRKFGFGVPIFLGHPDQPGRGGEFPDKASKGMIIEIEPREKGIFCRPVFNNDGVDLLAQRKLCFSTRWATDFVGEEGGKKVFRPSQLKSAGLVRSSNLPVEYLNNKPKETIMEKTVLIALLKRLGVEIANDAADQAVTAGIESLGQKVVSFANDKTGLENKVTDLTTKLTAEQGRVSTLTTERDAARTEFANERQARITDALGLAVTGGRITEAERPDWERRLKADFANESAALSKLAPKVKVKSVTEEMGGRKVEMSNIADRGTFIQAAIDQVAAELKLDRTKDYDRLFAEVQKRYPAVFQAMQPVGHSQ